MVHEEKTTNKSKLLFRALTIGGRNILLLPDRFQDSPDSNDQLLVAQATKTTPPCWVTEDLAEDFQGRFPKSQLYGFWQTMISSGAVDLANRLTIFVDGSDGNPGDVVRLYLETDGTKVLSSGRVVAGHLPVDVSTPIQDAVYLTIEPDQLKAPTTKFRLPSQIVQENAAFRQRIQGYSLIAAVIIIAFCAGYSYQKTKASEAIQERLDQLQATSGRAKRQVDSLRKEHVTQESDKTRGKQAIAYMLDLVLSSNKTQVDTMDLSQADGFEAVASGLDHWPEWADLIQINERGNYVVRYKAGN